MSTGREYAGKIDKAIAKLGHDHDAQAASLDALNREIAATQRAVSKAYVAIAKEHVAALDSHELQSYDRVTEEASFRIRARIEEIGQLRGQLAKCLSDEEREARHQAAAVEQRDRAANKVRALEGDVDQALSGNDEHLQLEAERAAAKDVARRASEKASTAAAESATKARAYEDDPIFMYLHGRGYGTDTYRRKVPRLVRLVDGWLAALCRFEVTGQDYLTLTTMPAYLASHAARMQAEARETGDRSGRFRRRHLKAAGIDPLIQTLRESEQHLAGRDAELAAARDALKSTRVALHEVEEWKDAASAALLARMASVFSHEGFEKLRQRVASTATGDDDAQLSRIARWLEEMKDKRSRATEIRTYIQSIDDRTKALVDLRRQYKQKGYDSSDYRVSGNKVDDLLTGFMLGTVVGGDLWNGISRSVHYDPPYTPSSSSGGSAFGGGGAFKSGGSFGGHGGFSTGGGF